MADVVRSGIIFRVRSPSAMRSPLPRLAEKQAARSRSRLTAPTPDGKASALESVMTAKLPPRDGYDTPRGEEEDEDPRVAALQSMRKSKLKRKKKKLKPTPARSDAQQEQQVLKPTEATAVPSAPSPVDVFKNFNRLVMKSPMPKRNAPSAAVPVPQSKGRRQRSTLVKTGGGLGALGAGDVGAAKSRLQPTPAKQKQKQRQKQQYKATPIKDDYIATPVRAIPRVVAVSGARKSGSRPAPKAKKVPERIETQGPAYADGLAASKPRVTRTVERSPRGRKRPRELMMVDRRRQPEDEPSEDDSEEEEEGDEGYGEEEEDEEEKVEGPTGYVESKPTNASGGEDSEDSDDDSDGYKYDGTLIERVARQEQEHDTVDEDQSVDEEGDTAVESKPDDNEEDEDEQSGDDSDAYRYDGALMDRVAGREQENDTLDEDQSAEEEGDVAVGSKPAYSSHEDDNEEDKDEQTGDDSDAYRYDATLIDRVARQEQEYDTVDEDQTVAEDGDVADVEADTGGEDADPSEDEAEQDDGNDYDGEDSSDEESVDGAEDSDNDEVRIRKRLIFSDTPPAKTKARARSKRDLPSHKSSRSIPVGKQPPASSPEDKRRTDRPLGSKLSKSSLQAYSSPRRTPQRLKAAQIQSPAKILLSNWYLRWPLPYDDNTHQYQLVLIGHVLGKRKSFTVQRRITASKFVSTTNEYIRLDGELDIDRAENADLPKDVMVRMMEGIPQDWRDELESLRSQGPKYSKQSKKPTRRVLSDESSELSDSSYQGENSHSTSVQTKANASNTLGNPEQHTRSGRRVTPVMEWWRNERKLLDKSGESHIDPGSPAYLPSVRVKSFSPMRGHGSRPPSTRAGTVKSARRKVEVNSAAVNPTMGEWTPLQLAAMEQAKTVVNTTESNFWAEVAQYVPGKTADECRKQSFHELSVRMRKTGVSGKRAASAVSAPPTKIHRAGSNKFKKQVREFVHQYEKKHVDDLFSQDTPTKADIPDAMGFDDLKSPPGSVGPKLRGEQGDPDWNSDGDEDEGDLLDGVGRELLEKIPLNKRDEVDSYVLKLKRSHSGLGGPMAIGRGRRALEPSPLRRARVKTTMHREELHLVEEVGSHMVEAVVSPNGTTRVRVNKGSDDDDDAFYKDEDADEFEDGDEW